MFKQATRLILNIFYITGQILQKQLNSVVSKTRVKTRMTYSYNEITLYKIKSQLFFITIPDNN